jgi:hypothetical protein
MGLQLPSNHRTIEGEYPLTYNSWRDDPVKGDRTRRYPSAAPRQELSLSGFDCAQFER